MSAAFSISTRRKSQPLWRLSQNCGVFNQVELVHGPTQDGGWQLDVLVLPKSRYAPIAKALKHFFNLRDA